MTHRLQLRYEPKARHGLAPFPGGQPMTTKSVRISWTGIGLLVKVKVLQQYSTEASQGSLLTPPTPAPPSERTARRRVERANCSANLANQRRTRPFFFFWRTLRGSQQPADPFLIFVSRSASSRGLGGDRGPHGQLKSTRNVCGAVTSKSSTRGRSIEQDKNG